MKFLRCFDAVVVNALDVLADDMQTPDGQLVSHPIDFGKSWQVTDDLDDDVSLTTLLLTPCNILNIHL